MKRLLPLLLLVLFSACNHDRVHRLSIATDGGLVWDDDRAATVVVDGDTLYAEAHLRGGFSRNYPKHSLSLKTDAATTLCGLPEGRNYVLNASYVDRTFLRHKLSFDLFRAMDPDNRAPQCAYVWLAVDGEEWGLYVLMQKPDRRMLDVVRADSTSAVFKEPPLLYPVPPAPQDSLNPLNQKYPKLKKDDRTAQHEALRSLLFEADDSTFAATVGQHFDLDNIADWQLLVMLTNNSDGLRKGFYLYKASDSTPWRIALWDYDHSFGRDGDGEYNMLDRIAPCDSSVLFRRLMQLPSYRGLLVDRWQHLRQAGIITPDAIDRRIKQNLRTMRRDARRDAELWPTAGLEYLDGTTIDAEVDIMRQFTRKNIHRLDSLLSR